GRYRKRLPLADQFPFLPPEQPPAGAVFPRQPGLDQQLGRPLNAYLRRHRRIRKVDDPAAADPGASSTSGGNSQPRNRPAFLESGWRRAADPDLEFLSIDVWR